MALIHLQRADPYGKQLDAAAWLCGRAMDNFENAVRDPRRDAFPERQASRQPDEDEDDPWRGHGERRRLRSAGGLWE